MPPACAPSLCLASRPSASPLASPIGVSLSLLGVTLFLFFVPARQGHFAPVSSLTLVSVRVRTPLPASPPVHYRPLGGWRGSPAPPRMLSLPAGLCRRLCRFPARRRGSRFGAFRPSQVKTVKLKTLQSLCTLATCIYSFEPQCGEHLYEITKTQKNKNTHTRLITQHKLS